MTRVRERVEPNRDLVKILAARCESFVKLRESS